MMGERFFPTVIVVMGKSFSKLHHPALLHSVKLETMYTSNRTIKWIENLAEQELLIRFW